MDKNKIMFIMHDINYGGAAKMFAFLANGLEKEGNEVCVYTYEGKEPYYPLNNNVNFIPVKKIPQSFLLQRFLPFFRVRNTIKKVKPDIVISFLPNSNLYSFIGTVFTNTALIITERSDPYTERGLLMDLKRFFYRFADGAVFQTEGAKRYYKRNLQKKGIVIPNPVTLQKEQRIPYLERKNELAFVARFDIHQKRQDIMTLAFKKVAEKDSNIKLIFYGDGADMVQIKNMVNELKLTDRVIFAGKVNDILEKIREAKLYVSTSDYEGISNSLIEAMAAGLPVVATDCSPGGAKLLIKHNKNGILVSKGNINAIADSILFLLNNPQIADQLGADAQDIVDEFAPNKIIESWNFYINKVLRR